MKGRQAGAKPVRTTALPASCPHPGNSLNDEEKQPLFGGAPSLTQEMQHLSWGDWLLGEAEH